MAIKEKDVAIAGRDYKLTQLGAVEGRKLWIAVLRVLAPTIRALASAKELNQEAVFTAVATVVENLDDETHNALAEAFRRKSRIRSGENWPELSREEIFDDAFAGNYVAYTQWLGENLVFNFANFLGDISIGKMLDAAQAAVSKSASPKASTGSPTAS